MTREIAEIEWLGVGAAFVSIFKVKTSLTLGLDKIEIPSKLLNRLHE